MKILTKGNYYGEKKLELNSGGIVLSEYTYDQPQTDWHYHENPYFMYVLQGDVYDHNKKRSAPCSAGSFLLHNWDEQHMNSMYSSRARGFHLEFERQWFDEKRLDISLLEGSVLIEDPHMHAILAKIYFEFRCQDNFSQVSIDLLLLQLCEQTRNIHLRTESEPSWIPHLRQILNEEVESLSLKSLSDKLGVHPVHLSRSVPRYLHTTLGDYIRRQKIKRAIPHLLNLQFSLTEVAFICGFSDQSHFTRTFKTYFQKTPREFRKMFAAC